MLAWLAEAGKGTPADPQGWLFRTGTKLLDTFTDVAGGADRAKIYRMLAGLAGVRTLDAAADPLGRPARALAYTAPTPRYGLDRVAGLPRPGLRPDHLHPGRGPAAGPGQRRPDRRDRAVQHRRHRGHLERQALSGSPLTVRPSPLPRPWETSLTLLAESVPRTRRRWARTLVVCGLAAPPRPGRARLRRALPVLRHGDLPRRDPVVEQRRRAVRLRRPGPRRARLHLPAVRGVRAHAGRARSPPRRRAG